MISVELLCVAVCMTLLASFFLPSASLINIYMYVHVLMSNEKEGRKKQARSNKQQGKQHSTPKAVAFPKKNELPRVGLKTTTLYTLERALYQLSYQGSTAGWAQISHFIVHLMNRLTMNSV